MAFTDLPPEWQRVWTQHKAETPQEWNERKIREARKQAQQEAEEPPYQIRGRVHGQLLQSLG
jgi:hypothetical protein